MTAKSIIIDNHIRIEAETAEEVVFEMNRLRGAFGARVTFTGVEGYEGMFKAVGQITPIP